MSPRAQRAFSLPGAAMVAVVAPPLGRFVASVNWRTRLSRTSLKGHTELRLGRGDHQAGLPTIHASSAVCWLGVSNSLTVRSSSTVPSGKEPGCSLLPPANKAGRTDSFGCTHRWLHSHGLVARRGGQPVETADDRGPRGSDTASTNRARARTDEPTADGQQHRRIRMALSRCHRSRRVPRGDLLLALEAPEPPARQPQPRIADQAHHPAVASG